ncbi:hypothetical protein [Nocardioides sp. LHG3406-4]|uniref:hypothetical protein n=1 Tax=Nocardioides sp. LHG3406-4 TaxID=2804575 RepID=UPI003CF97CC0
MTALIDHGCPPCGMSGPAHPSSTRQVWGLFLLALEGPCPDGSESEAITPTMSKIKLTHNSAPDSRPGKRKTVATITVPKMNI